MADNVKVSPVVAVHKVVYGKAQAAPAGTLFSPTSKAEADELVALKAVRKPTAAELAVWEQMQPKAAAKQAPKAAKDKPAAEAKAAEAAATELADGADSNSAPDSDPIG